MKKITIIFFSSSENTYKKIHLNRFAYSLLAGILLILVFSCLIFSGLFFYHQKELAETKQKVNYLTNQVKKIPMLKSALQDRERHIMELKKQLDIARQDLSELYEMEVKIKRFLGLEEEPETGNFTHQGGFQGGLDFRQNSTNYNLDTSGTTITFDVLKYSKELKETLNQLTEILEQRQLSLSHTPSILPVQGDHLWISCGYGWRINPFTQKREFHGALDIAGPWKTPIVAPADGVVIEVNKNKFNGNYLKIRHADKIITTYCHLHKAIVKKGQKVKRGDVIGYMGNTGLSTGTHLHYAIQVGNKFVNPYYYIYDKKIVNLSLK